jgi:multidrug efflux pump subunit AcrA (membrane-fusion protein)
MSSAPRPIRRVTSSILLLAGALGVLLLSGCEIISPAPPSAQTPPEPRRILNRAPFTTPGAGTAGLELMATVKRGTLVDSLALSGNAFPLRSAQLTFQTNGTISALPVRSGQAVRQGDRLAELSVDLAGAPAQPAAVLTAPFDALVTAVEVGVGQSVTPQSTVVRLADASRYYVSASASEFDVLRLEPDQSADVTFPAVSTAAVGGVIVDVGQVGTVQGDRVQFPVRVNLERAPAQLRPGMSARVNVALRRAENVLYVPSGAIRRSEGDVFVTRVDRGQVTDVAVTVGETFGGDVEIRSGLNEGDVVAVYSQAPLVR